MIRFHFSAAGLQRIVLDNPTAPGREFDLAALIVLRPHVLAADRALVELVSEALHPHTGKDESKGPDAA